MRWILLLISFSLFAQAEEQSSATAAQALLNQLIQSGAVSQEQIEGLSVAQSYQGLSLKSAFDFKVLDLLQRDKSLSEPIKAAMRASLKGKDKEVIEKVMEMQAELHVPALNAIYLRSLFREKLYQTFLSQWIHTPLERELKQLLSAEVSAGFDRLFVNQGLQLTGADSEGILTKAIESPIDLTLRAWVELNRINPDVQFLEMLPLEHALMVPLARRHALLFAKKGELGKAGAILKNYSEPAVKLAKDPYALADHYLQIARLLYQVGQLDAADLYYSKIPGRSDRYLTAQEERMWVKLRQGKHGELRGIAESFSSRVFDGVILPEVELVRAISDIKLCRYEDGLRSLNRFIKKNSNWAKLIDQNVEAKSATRPVATLSKLSFFENAEASRKSEMSQLNAYPSLNHQRETVQKLHDVAVSEIEKSKKSWWRSQKNSLKHALTQMKFVRLELMSQLFLAKKSRADSNVKPMDAMSTQGSEQVFLHDGVFWADEVFHLKSIANKECERFQGSGV